MGADHMLEAMRNLAARATAGTRMRLLCIARCRVHAAPGCDA
jgi:hypothetical protein